jgi:hypothetical protein
VDVDGRLELYDATIASQMAYAGPTYAARGGGIFVATDGDLLVTSNTLIRDNAAYGGDTSGGTAQGGAVYAEANTALEFNESQLDNNLARGGDASGSNFGGIANGGAVDSAGTLYIYDSVFSDNQARAGDSAEAGGGSAFGGAINRGNSTIDEIRDSIFRGNVARGGDSSSASASDSAGQANGGALYGFGGNIDEINNSLFEDNQAVAGTGHNAASGEDGQGGAILEGGTIGVIRRSTFVNNYALSRDSAGEGSNGRGGAIFNFGTISNLRNSTFTGNVAQGSDAGAGNGGDATGGAIFNSGSITSFTHNTLSANHAMAGSGTPDGTAGGGSIFNLGTFNIADSILANSTVTPGGSSATPNECDYTSTLPNSGGYNLVQNPGSCSLSFNAAGDQTGLEAELGPLVDNGCGAALLDGSCVPTHLLLASSPALDGGSCGVSGVNADQRGQSRPFDVSAVANVADACDIGAVELQQQVPANLPTVLDVRVYCESIEVDYLARNPDGSPPMTLLVYRAVPGATDEAVAQMSVSSSRDAERYSQTLDYGRVYPTGSSFYVVLSAADGTLTTPAQPCSTPPPAN